MAQPAANDVALGDLLEMRQKWLLLVSLMLTAALAAMNKFFGNALGMPTFIWGIIGFIVSFAVVTALFAAILSSSSSGLPSALSTTPSRLRSV